MPASTAGARVHARHRSCGASARPGCARAARGTSSAASVMTMQRSRTDRIERYTSHVQANTMPVRLVLNAVKDLHVRVLRCAQYDNGTLLARRRRTLGFLTPPTEVPECRLTR